MAAGLEYLKHAGRTIAILAVVLPSLLSCSGKKDTAGAKTIVCRDSVAVMETSGITSVITENGMPKYRIKTEKWDVYDMADPPFWSFEYGAYLEVLDSVCEVASLISADTAYYYSADKKWELRGRVHAENVDGEVFDTELLFWDQLREKVYSDCSISIRQDRQTIYGRGFESNQDFTCYTIRHTDGIFPAEGLSSDTEE